MGASNLNSPVQNPTSMPRRGRCNFKLTVALLKIRSSTREDFMGVKNLTLVGVF